jgi:hypothetical protein
VDFVADEALPSVKTGVEEPEFCASLTRIVGAEKPNPLILK